MLLGKGLFIQQGQVTNVVTIAADLWPSKLFKSIGSYQVLN